MVVDRLLIEIEFNNSPDFVFALIHLANTLAKDPTVYLRELEHWEHHKDDDYSIKWRYESVDDPPVDIAAEQKAMPQLLERYIASPARVRESRRPLRAKRGL